MPPTLFDEPLVAFGREICGDPVAALRREWLVTNGIGGYASGTADRRHHPLLPRPAGRRARAAGGAHRARRRLRRLGDLRRPARTRSRPTSSGTASFAPDGYRYLESFRLEGTLPVWTFAVADALVERRLWMAHGANTTYVTYRLLRGSPPARPRGHAARHLSRSPHPDLRAGVADAGREPGARRDRSGLRRGDAAPPAGRQRRVPPGRPLVVELPPPRGDARAACAITAISSRPAPSSPGSNRARR